MSYQQRMLNLFRASLAVVSVDSPSPAQLNVMEQVQHQVAALLDLPCFCWDLGDGMRRIVPTEDNSIDIEVAEQYPDCEDPIAALDAIRDSSGDGIFIMRNLHVFLSGDKADQTVIEKLMNLCLTLKHVSKRLILLGQDVFIPNIFNGILHELHNPLPSILEIQSRVCLTIATLREKFEESGLEFEVDLDAEQNQRLFRACQGLTGEEIDDKLRLAAVTYNGRINERVIAFINQEKIAKLKKYRVEFSEPPDVAVGGLDRLKVWVKQRTPLFNAQASGEASQLPPPKGLIVFGPPGTGKSLTAKTLGHSWGIPILSFDMGSIYGSLLGESEANLQRILRAAEAIAPCVLHLDELDKAFAGVSGPSTDSGTKQGIFGMFLTWMSNKRSPVFVVATANRLDGIPPELLRKGRFDEIFLVDVPNLTERVEILTIHLAKYDCELPSKDLKAVAVATKNFGGAELAALVQEAVVQAYSEGQPGQVKADVLLELAKDTTPMAEQQREAIQRMRDSLKGAKLASTPEDETPQKSRRAADGMRLT